MAVPKRRTTRSRRNKRRAHDARALPTLTQDVNTGEVHLRHHVAPSGMYRGVLYPLGEAKNLRKKVQTKADNVE